ncbi:MAG: hypothetical protein LBK53_07505 [Heliobacteriaceae bacterium]|jgi:hypothetical protein|nr:hypothetical protein [Heliobacteriaceae bacterium]
MREFELNLSVEELEKRIHKDYMTTKKLLSADAPEYLNLAHGDKEALKYLVKAANVLEDINLKIDSHDNLEFREYLKKEIANGNTQAELTKILFDAQKGINAVDTETNIINLAKGVYALPGKGVYPKDLGKEEFHAILIEMINAGKTDEAGKILNQRSVVERDGDLLKACDYIDYFKDEFAQMADFLDKASEVSTNADFNEYLKLQSKALRTADPMLDAYADKKWAELQDTPLEFTITRENYEDEMTSTVLENEELKELLDKNGIEPVSKDFLGGRAGIVNKKGTEALLKIKDYLPLLAQNMPYNDEYEQNINIDADTNQTMADVDLVILSGDVGEYRGGITVAENLPNNDKLSLTIGGGRRNVYHRQIRFVSQPEKLRKRLDATLDPAQHKYYDTEAEHTFTIGHENAHSLGPKDGGGALGKYRNIIEDNKADMGAVAFLDLLVENGMYTQEEADKIAFTFAADLFLKSKPSINQAHRVRTVMQNKYFTERGVLELNREGKIHIHREKIIPAAKEMLAQIVRIQTDKDIKKAEEYITGNFIWTPEMELISQKLKEVNKTLNGKLKTGLADYLLSA